MARVAESRDVGCSTTHVIAGRLRELPVLTTSPDWIGWMTRRPRTALRGHMSMVHVGALTSFAM